ncbi:sterol desaturase family protein [Mucilaginibacter terrenus]|nr:sterol desaturase family protein [Mucilaginibacter terrenus]
MLEFLATLSETRLWLIFLAENLTVTAIALFAGWLTLKLCIKSAAWPSRAEFGICIITNLVNTIITYLGFRLWDYGFIIFRFDFSWTILPHFLLLFIGMDFLMYVFHYFIHHSVFYKPIHRFHHQYEHPTPIDLFVLHPLETVSFGALWLILLIVYSFNIYAVAVYLTVNVAFGIAGHLGTEPLPAKYRSNALLKFIGTSSFHHDHHADINYNFGFYTSIWDRLFGTFKP